MLRPQVPQEPGQHIGPAGAINWLRSGCDLLGGDEVCLAYQGLVRGLVGDLPTAATARASAPPRCRARVEARALCTG